MTLDNVIILAVMCLAPVVMFFIGAGLIVILQDQYVSKIVGLRRKL